MRAAALASAILLLGACNAGGAHQGREQPGPTVQRNFEVGAFDKITLAGSHDVIVTVGGAPSVRAEGETADLDRLEIAVVDGQLRIGNREGNSWSWFGHHRGITVHVTVPSLAAASIAGSGDMRVDRIEGARFDASIAGSGDLDIANLRAAETSFAVTGSGGIRAAGAGQRANASVTGSGDVELGGYETADATIALVGSGDINLRATRTAAVELRGSGDVTVGGTARCTINKSGSGDVHCGG